MVKHAARGGVAMLLVASCSYTVLALPITPSVNWIKLFSSLCCHLQQNGRGMYTDPSTAYRYEGTLGHFVVS